MRILALDTATEACSAALYVDGVTHDRFRMAPRRHAELILPMANELLREANLELDDLDALAFGAGPGSFTGVRIAAAVTQGLALGAGLPVVGVSTLAAVAQEVISTLENASVAVALDARMNEVYFGLYRRDDGGLAQQVGEERVCPPNAVSALPPGTWIGAGPGWQTHGCVLREALGGAVSGVKDDLFPNARYLAQLARPLIARGQVVTPGQAIPNYVRDDVVSRSGKRG